MANPYKAIPFRTENQKGVVHVVNLSQVKSELISLNISEPVEISWANDGRYTEIWLTKKHAVCPFCGTANNLGIEDLGFEEFECDHCNSPFQIPNTSAELPAFNLDSLKASTESRTHSHYRVMFRGEDGYESCLKNGVPAEYAELVCAGFQSHYTEGQKCWLEPEETLADLRHQFRDELY